MSLPSTRSLQQACAGMRLALIVPAHNEGAVIERRLRNLLTSEWPPGAHHRLIVVDDQSSDDTYSRAQDLVLNYPMPPGLNAEVVRSTGRPGKPTAVRTGLDRLEPAGAFDLALISDADVVNGLDSLLALAAAFRADGQLAIACGSQHFVDALCQSGQLIAPECEPLRRAGGAYDGWTAVIRRWESSQGRLFSLHGQLMAWRLGQDLMPRVGFAADDLDLVLQLRERPRSASKPWRVRVIRDAAFYETKPAAGPVADQQALRRARAYVQVLRASRPPRQGWLTWLQWSLYRVVPIWAPELMALALAAGLLALLAWKPWGAAIGLLCLIAVLFTPVGRRGLVLMGVIRRARRMESEGAQPERWEMAR